jgi:hypothetical protein
MLPRYNSMKITLFLNFMITSSIAICWKRLQHFAKNYSTYQKVFPASSLSHILSATSGCHIFQKNVKFVSLQSQYIQLYKLKAGKESFLQLLILWYYIKTEMVKKLLSIQ